VNPRIIARFPRYQELADLRTEGADFSTQEHLDLQVFLNLAWTDLDLLAEPLSSDLVDRGRDFVESD
jgi:hypothetical protein